MRLIERSKDGMSVSEREVDLKDLAVEISKEIKEKKLLKVSDLEAE